MTNRGQIYSNWTTSKLPDQHHSESLINGAQLEVRARETLAESIELLVCVYDPSGVCVVERVEKLSALEWTIADALQRGRDQAERIAGGESGRLPCADAGQTEH